ncbi:restriction endonuclease fold toxin 5 domain-containing protein [Burkholderia ubonensis]|uniref:restriction endonuclease fold toxin 5 domain-containing protein n=1 Tax=Burkholderia ubonensis TaxID=101571 RepID=UPI000B2E18C1|nr:restriction endonuclease fold toxin 5 domain-containing protein [Burkholderia ubonensis]
MVGIFPPGLGAAGHAVAQTAPMPLPLPLPGPSAGSMGGSGAGAGADADGGWGSLPRDRTRERDRPCKCPPEKGAMTPVNHSMSELSAEYQQYITKFPRGMEWLFVGTDFDGFDKGQCLLQETKANYDFFFDKNGKPKFFFFHGKGPNNEGKATSIPAKESIMAQAKNQSIIVRDNSPAKLRWYFMQEKFFLWATKEFSSKGLPIATEYKDMPVK